MMIMVLSVVVMVKVMPIMKTMMTTTVALKVMMITILSKFFGLFCDVIVDHSPINLKDCFDNDKKKNKKN